MKAVAPETYDSPFFNGNSDEILFAFVVEQDKVS